jgi:hypothetical protein
MGEIGRRQLCRDPRFSRARGQAFDGAGERVEAQQPAVEGRLEVGQPLAAVQEMRRLGEGAPQLAEREIVGRSRLGLAEIRLDRERLAQERLASDVGEVPDGRDELGVSTGFEQRPVPEAVGERGEPLPAPVREALAQQRERLAGAHLADGHVLAPARERVEIAGGDEARAAAAAREERPEMRGAPHVVYHEQDVALGEQLAEPRGGGIEPREAGPLAGEDLDQVFHLGRQVAGLLAERHPQHAVVERLLDALVVAERSRERGLAEAGRADQRHRAGHRLLAPRVAQQGDEPLELLGARHEAGGQVIGHEGDAANPRSGVEIVQQPVSLLG